MTLKGGASQACAACKYQRRRCLPECQLAPYFPADQPKMFQNAHRLFGVSNILKILKLVKPNERSEAMRSIIYESEIRDKEPVLGCFGFIQQLRYRVQLFENELQATRFQLMQFTHSNPNTNNHMMHFEPAEQQFQFVDDLDHQQQQQQQQFQVPEMDNMHNSFIDDGQSSFIDSKATYECSSSDTDELLSVKDLTTEHNRLVDSRHLKHSPAYFSLNGVNYLLK
ncbi:hypothetical protein QQ045_032054 [Rhodiola kirilowii]